MLLRGFLILVAGFAWLLLVWLSGHESTEPAVLGRFSLRYTTFLAALFVIALGLSFATFGPLFRMLQKASGEIFLTLTSILLSLLVLEGAIRWLDPLGISYYEEVRRYHNDKMADEDLIYRHRPYMDVEYQGVRVRTNSMGLRDRELTEDNGRRILLLGDSVAFGWGVAEEHLFSTLLEAELSNANRGTVEVVNTGVGSYETRQQLTYSRKYGSVLTPDVVVLLYVSNDVVMNGSFRPFDTVSPFRRDKPVALRILAWNSWSFRLVAHFDRIRNAKPLVPIRDDAGWRTSMASVAALAKLWAAEDVPFLVFLYRSTVTPRNTALLEDLEDLGRTHDFLVRDTLPVFEGKDLLEVTNSFVDSHPNAAGHALLVSHMKSDLDQALESNSALPAFPGHP